MDTKWKNRKRIISFLTFFLGISLSLGSISGIFRAKPSDVRIWQLDRLLENDYQQSERFRGYVVNRLENLLIMATGGEGLPGAWEYGGGFCYDGYYYYSGSGYADCYDGYFDDYEYSYSEIVEDVIEQEDIREGRSTGEASYVPDPGKEQIKRLTDEQKKEIADRYHDSIKGDKNLLYAVLYDGEVLYDNGDLFSADGTPAAPEGYNFLLYFDGEKASIFKDGKEIDVYGDGYYHEDSDWYLPGYTNFQAGDAVKKAAVCIAAAKEPVLYSEGFYDNGGSRQYDNGLYWINVNLLQSREIMLQGFIGLGLGCVLLLGAFLGRKRRHEAAEGIARFQRKIWLEFKILLFLGLFYAPIFLGLRFGYDQWREWGWAYEYEYGLDEAFFVGRQLAESIPPLFWIVLFWSLWLFYNDFKYNKKIWRCSLTAKLYRAFSAKNLHLPLSRKMARRNQTVFLGAFLYGILMLGGSAAAGTVLRGEYALIAVLLISVLGTVFFLILQYLYGKENMKVAKDVEVLSDRITQIRNGDYGAARDGEKDCGTDGADISGADCGLEIAMARLEDIRHGMAMAVDEQMKSERMKVELIANVSHDIKTPLTSIISYVEILKQEEGLPDHIKDYIKILDEKSQRLNNMVQDVFAVSKAASGELPMQMEELDFVKLIKQTMADMEEQIQNSGVSFRTEFPKEPVMIMADGQRLYRVFQNLFQNAIKYSLKGSRVYVALGTEGALAVASVKNISLQELDKDKDFAERFARGDQSRTDGGSGLGLSIAQSFTEACGGKFSWETDADLFVVRVTFKILKA